MKEIVTKFVNIKIQLTVIIRENNWYSAFKKHGCIEFIEILVEIRLISTE